MAVCKKCNKVTDNLIDLVELKTMIVRNFVKSTRYQAMGNMLQAAVCDECITEYINAELDPKKKILYSVLAYCLFAAFGITLVILDLGGFLGVDDSVPKVFGLVVAIVSILSCIREMKNIKERIEWLKTEDSRRIRKLLAVELLSKYLPNKHNDADISYIDLEMLMKDNLQQLAYDSNSSVSKLEKMRRYIKKNGLQLSVDGETTTT